jgi:hypothetical protein
MPRVRRQKRPAALASLPLIGEQSCLVGRGAQLCMRAWRRLSSSDSAHPASRYVNT